MAKGKRAPSRNLAGQELIEDHTYVGKGGWHTRVGEVIYVLRTIRGHWMAYADQLERLVQGSTNLPLDEERLQLERIQSALSSVFNHRKADLTKRQVAQLKTSLHWAIITTSQRLRAIPDQARREKKAAHGAEKWLAKFAPGVHPAAGERARLSDTEKRAIQLCRKKYYKGQTLANEMGLSYDYARRVFAKLVKAGLLTNDQEKGYRTCDRHK
jgi:hypothetical protein